MKNLFVYGALAFLLFVGCDSSTEGPAKNEHLMNLKVGNRWIYEDVDLDSNGTVVDFDYDTIEVIGDTAIGGTTWYRLNQDEALYGNKSDGLYMLRFYLGDSTASFRWFKYPAAKNDISFEEYDTSSNYIYHFKIVVANTDTSVTVPGGTFNSVSYRASETATEISTGQIRPETGYEVYCWAPGHGLIAAWRFRQENGGQVFLRNRYQLKEELLH